ncbi:MAG: radical SAM family heme chaperone HemW [Fidelibacterota bacterium]|nr:MAG: radical SAM family heme chaperone HemW [Candidatus Neomarinimicrobiota bacterium]
MITAPAAGIYVHIPFCRSKCRYCDFYSLPDREHQIGRFVASLVTEIREAVDEVKGWKFDTVYIGGGTPNLLTPEQLGAVMQALKDTFGLEGLEECTMEANPGEASEAQLRGYREAGVNRISFGFQSFDPKLLQFLGRIHTPEDNFTSFEMARRAGFDNISCDLLFNIPGQSLKRWKADLAALVALGPEHISTYSLTMEQGTPLSEEVARGAIRMPEEETDLAMYTWAREYLAGQGYDMYEIGNHAREGRACRHNLHYWRIGPYLGFGPAAHRFDGEVRSWNVRDLDEYLKRVEGGESPVAGEERLTPVQLQNEKLAFGLRLREGLSVTEEMGYESVEAFVEVYGAKLEQLHDSVVLNADRLSLTEKGVLLADSVTAELFLDEEGEL